MQIKQIVDHCEQRNQISNLQKTPCVRTLELVEEVQRGLSTTSTVRSRVQNTSNLGSNAAVSVLECLDSSKLCARSTIVVPSWDLRNNLAFRLPPISSTYTSVASRASKVTQLFKFDHTYVFWESFTHFSMYTYYAPYFADCGIRHCTLIFSHRMYYLQVHPSYSAHSHS